LIDNPNKILPSSEGLHSLDDYFLNESHPPWCVSTRTETFLNKTHSQKSLRVYKESYQLDKKHAVVGEDANNRIKNFGSKLCIAKQ
jgi:hypothetical protein